MKFTMQDFFFLKLQNEFVYYSVVLVSYCVCVKNMITVLGHKSIFTVLYLVFITIIMLCIHIQSSLYFVTFYQICNVLALKKYIYTKLQNIKCCSFALLLYYHHGSSTVFLHFYECIYEFIDWRNIRLRYFLTQWN